jgi:hypothetical protein
MRPMSERWRTIGLFGLLAGLFAAGPSIGVDRGAIAALSGLFAWVWWRRR